MDIKEYLSLIKAKKQTIASVIILFFTITAIFTFTQQLNYNSKSSVLLIQIFPRGTDPAAMSKSNENISTILASVVSSNLFYNDVMNAGYNIDRKYFSKDGNVNDEMEKWQKTVQAKALSDTGIININIYHPDKQQLNQIAQAVNFVMQSKHGQYHGLGSNVVIKIINKPILSAWPTKPNIPVNLLLAIVVGLIVSLYYIYLFPEATYNIRLWPNWGRHSAGAERIFNTKFVNAKKIANFGQIKINQENFFSHGSPAESISRKFNDSSESDPGAPRYNNQDGSIAEFTVNLNMNEAGGKSGENYFIPQVKTN